MFNNICIFYWLVGSICKPTFTFSYENNEPIEIIQMQGKKKGWTKERSTTCHFKESTNRERSNHQMITDMLTFFILRYGKKIYIYFTYKAKKTKIRILQVSEQVKWLQFCVKYLLQYLPTQSFTQNHFQFVCYFSIYSIIMLLTVVCFF